MGTRLVVAGTLIVVKRGDITREDTAAIVNAANTTLLGGGGVDGAIHRAGGPEILDACREIVGRIGRLPTGEAVVTTGGELPARHVIHTVGPVWGGGQSGEPELLANAYRNSLALARKQGLGSISFPSISTGVYRYPIEHACEIALRTTFASLAERRFEEIRFVLFSDADVDVYDEAAPRIAREFGFGE